jgi:hypothetical protein
MAIFVTHKMVHEPSSWSAYSALCGNDNYVLASFKDAEVDCKKCLKLMKNEGTNDK